MLWQLFWLKISKNKCKCKPLLNALICKFSNTLLHCHLSLALFLLFSFFAVLRFVWFLLDGLFSILAPFWLPWMSNDRKAVFMASDSGVTVASIETEGKPDGNGHKVGSTPHPALQFSTFHQHWALYQLLISTGQIENGVKHFLESQKWRVGVDFTGNFVDGFLLMDLAKMPKLLESTSGDGNVLLRKFK